MSDEYGVINEIGSIDGSFYAVNENSDEKDKKKKKAEEDKKDKK